VVRPFTIDALKATDKRAILLLMGSGFRPCAVRYCLDQQDDSLLVLTAWDQLVRMFNTEQL